MEAAMNRNFSSIRIPPVPLLAGVVIALGGAGLLRAALRARALRLKAVRYQTHRY